jgi:hypothetical protein
MARQLFAGLVRSSSASLAQTGHEEAIPVLTADAPWSVGEGVGTPLRPSRSSGPVTPAILTMEDEDEEDFDDDDEGFEDDEGEFEGDEEFEEDEDFLEDDDEDLDEGGDDDDEEDDDEDL